MADIFIAPHEQSSQPVTVAQTLPVQAKAGDPLPKPVSPPGLFTTFCPYPDQVTFDTQEDNEQMLLFLRRHFITNIPWIVSVIALLLIPMVIIFVFRFTVNLFPVPNPEAFTLVLVLFYYLAVITIGFVYFISWFYNISFVTNIRVEDIDFSGLVYKNVSATKITLIEDVSFTQVGTIRSVFDYGDVLVQTAGTLDNFDFEAVPHPERVVQIINELIGKEEQNA